MKTASSSGVPGQPRGDEADVHPRRVGSSPMQSSTGTRLGGTVTLTE